MYWERQKPGQSLRPKRQMKPESGPPSVEREWGGGRKQGRTGASYLLQKMLEALQLGRGRRCLLREAIPAGPSVFLEERPFCPVVGRERPHCREGLSCKVKWGRGLKGRGLHK